MNFKLNMIHQCTVFNILCLRYSPSSAKLAALRIRKGPKSYVSTKGNLLQL